MDEENVSVLGRLQAMFPQASKTTLREMIESKRVRLNGAVVRSAKQAVGEKDKLEVTNLSEAPARITALAENLQLMFCDRHIAVVDKPAGLLTSTHSEEERPTALRILTTYFQRQNSKNQVHLVHRLDRDASGLLVFARTVEALRSLKHQFAEHSLTRRYDAIVHGIPAKKQGRLENFLLEDERTGIVHPTKDERKGKLAILDYVTIQSDAKKKIAHLQCTLFTGRKHQIRVQLKAIGHAVVGDPLYGPKARSARGPATSFEDPPYRLALHASHLTFVHPGSKKEVSFDSQMPGGFAHLFRS